MGHIMSIILSIFHPYLLVQQSIVWAIFQNMEGSAKGGGLFLVSFEIVTIFVWVVLAATCFGMLLTTWRHSRHLLFPLSTFIWSLPGITSLIRSDAFLGFEWVAKEFVIAGAPGGVPVGSLTGGVLTTALFIAFGTVLFTNFIDWFGRLITLKRVIDFIWYPMGILMAAMFLIQISHYQETREKLEEAKNDIRKAAMFLGFQLSNLEVENKNNKLSKFINESQIDDMKAVIKSTKYRVQELSQSDNFFVEESFNIGEPEKELRNQLDRFNEEACKEVLNKCVRLPLALGIKFLNAGVMHGEPDQRVKFIPYVIFDFIEQKISFVASLNNALRDLAPLKNTRWLAFMLIGFLAGGKVATAIYPAEKTGGKF